MRLMVIHKLPEGLTREDVIRLQQSAQQDPEIKGYRSFLSLSECTGVCLFDAPSKERLESWLRERNLPYDRIVTVELEGERGKIIELPLEVGAGV